MILISGLAVIPKLDARYFGVSRSKEYVTPLNDISTCLNVKSYRDHIFICSGRRQLMEISIEKCLNALYFKQYDGISQYCHYEKYNLTSPTFT